MSDTTVAAAIVRHIEELEVALRHLQNVMDPRIEKEAGRLIERKRKEFGWAGEVDDHLEPISWLAPESWRMAGDTDDSFDLYMNFEGTDCIDGAGPETWVAQFLGFAGSGMCFMFGTNALDRNKWKALLRSDAAIESLVENGFICDPRSGTLAMPVLLHKEALISAFEGGVFSDALAPIGLSLDRINGLRTILDQLVSAIRAKS